MDKVCLDLATNPFPESHIKLINDNLSFILPEGNEVMALPQEHSRVAGLQQDSLHQYTELKVRN